MTAAASTLVPTASDCWSRPPQEIWLSLLWAHCSFFLGTGTGKILFVASKSGLCFLQSYGSPIIKFFWTSKSDSLGFLVLLPNPWAERLMWDSEPPQQWENFFGIIVLQFVGHSPSGYGIWFIMIVIFLPSHCSFPYVFGHGVSCFWWAPESSCGWLFNS